MWVNPNPGRQPSTATATHFTAAPPHLSGTGKEEGRRKARKLAGRDKNGVTIKVQEERKKTK